MNTKKVILSTLVLVAVSGGSFWMGSLVTHAKSDETKAEQISTDGSFTRGLKVGDGRHAWLQSAYSRVYLNGLDSTRDDAADKMRSIARDNMWYAIIELDEFTRNIDADAEDQAAASRVLALVVDYYRKNPRKIEPPEGTKLAEDYSKIADAEISDGDMNTQEKEIFSEISDTLKGPLSESEGAFDGVLSELYKRDLATQTVLDRLVQERHLPGKKLQWSGFTLWMPRVGRGSGGGSGDEFDYSGTGIELSYREGILTMNGNEYGGLSKGDIIDFRDEGIVIVNGVKRAPRTQK
jgi:hypothetical protein